MANMLGNILGNNPKNNAPNSPQNMVQNMINQNPSLMETWRQAQSMAQGKSEAEIMNMINQLAKQKGIDLNQIIKMFK